MADQESNNVTKEQDRRGVGMLTNTLSSLAILKVNIDHGTDYLDYLRPFILHVLIEENPERITDRIVSAHILSYFGLKIPERVVGIVFASHRKTWVH